MLTAFLAKLPPRYDRATIRRLLLALLIGGVGGAVFAWFDLPLAWMLGAMAATMAGSLAGADIAVPQSLRKPMIAIVGVILGSTFTSDRFEDVIKWLPSVATMPIYVLALGAPILFYLRKVSGFDHKTAFFAATPGGLSEMTILADQLGGDLRSVAMFHSARLVLIIFSIPLMTSFFVTIEPVASLIVPEQAISPVDLACLIAMAALGWFVGQQCRLPAASFMGPLFVSTAAHLTGLVALSPPAFMLAAAQLVIGASVGARFSGIPLRVIGRILVIGGGGALMMFALTLIFAAVLHLLTGYPMTLLLLALIPGGFPEMSLIALSMGMDPAFVVTHHGIRTLLIFAFAFPIFALLTRLRWFERHWPITKG